MSVSRVRRARGDSAMIWLMWKRGCGQHDIEERIQQRLLGFDG